MAEQMWYYAEGDGQKGPVAWEQLWQMAQSGTIRPDQLVWTDGMANWQPAGQVPSLMPSAAPPLQGQNQPTPGYSHPVGYATPSHGPHDPTGAATAGLVLGLCSLVFCWCPLAGIALGITGMVFGAKGKRSSSPGMATWGFWLSLVGLVLSVLNSALGVYFRLNGTL